MPVKREKAAGSQKGGGPAGRGGQSDEVKEIFRAATPKAAALLVKMIDNEEATANLRMDAAKTVLDRVYGKASQPIEGELDGVLEIVAGDGVRELLG